jgi:threonine dehydrogenase-like Zn-dependent dehydrogenase
MRAVGCKEGRLDVLDLEPPRPAGGQVLIEVVRCGICGSDLHAREHCDELAGVLAEAGYDGFMRSHQEVVFGHEFCGTVAEYGPGCSERVRVGSPIVALPLLRCGDEVHAIGLSSAAPGAYAERMLVQESLMIPVPNGLPPQSSVLTEPMAVAWHAVRRSEIRRRDVAIVVGCGPIGLAVICMLKTRGVRTIVASDFSPGRRALALECGATMVVDPKVDSPYAAAGDSGHIETIPQLAELGLDTIERLRRLPVHWRHLWRATEVLGIKPKAPVVFECVGLPGVIDEIVAGAPLLSRVAVVGVCMGTDRLRPSMAVNKEIDLRFVVGYSPLEFRDTLHMLADGKVDVGPLVTAQVALEDVGGAFTALGDPERHAKILIDPRLSRTSA